MKELDKVYRKRGPSKLVIRFVNSVIRDFGRLRRRQRPRLCKRGHLIAGSNILYHGAGYKRCRECVRLRSALIPKRLRTLSGLAVWWFAIVLNGGPVYFEYRSLEACSIVQKAYARVLSVNKGRSQISTCQRYHEEEPLKNKGSVVIDNGIDNAS